MTPVQAIRCAPLNLLCDGWRLLNPRSCNVTAMASPNECCVGSNSRHSPEKMVSVQDIRHSVQREEPHEEKVIAQALRKLELKMEIVVEPSRKEPEERPATEPDAINPV